MKKKDLKYFVRFGGCSIKTQKGFNSSDSFHSPPAPKGFYAMPFLAQEHFLLGSMTKYQPGVMPKIKDNSCEWTSEEWDAFYKKQKRAKSAMRKEFFKNEGNIWHHLVEYTPHHKVLESHGSWIKTDIKDWETAFIKMSVALRAESIKYNRDFPERYGTGINNVRGITGVFSKDHCEVFFDEKV